MGEHPRIIRPRIPALVHCFGPARLESRALVTAQPAEPPWYGPVCPVVWEGRHRECSPIPISVHKASAWPATMLPSEEWQHGEKNTSALRRALRPEALSLRYTATAAHA